MRLNLTFALLIGLAACGKDDPVETGATPGGTTATGTPTGTGTPTPPHP